MPPGLTKGWVPPGDGWVKLNTDAGFYQSTGSASIGVVARDSQGKVLLYAWCFLYNVASAEEAEALVLLYYCTHESRAFFRNITNFNHVVGTVYKHK
jgi:hypothetical protein